MFKTTILLFTIFSTMAAASCGNCSPQCLDCRIRGFSRLTPDKSLAECYLEIPAPAGKQPYQCPGLGLNRMGVPSILGTPVCRQARCDLTNGERCKLKRLNEDTCNFFVASANSALDSSLSGCFTYALQPNVGMCPSGYDLYCVYEGVTDTLPSDISINPTSVYAVIPDLEALVQYITRPPPPPAPGTPIPVPCPNTITLPSDSSKVLQLVIETCVEVSGTVFPSPYAEVLANGASSDVDNLQTLIVAGIAGSYYVTSSNLDCGPERAKSPLVIGDESVPRCYYLLQNKDNDPTGCEFRA